MRFKLLSGGAILRDDGVSIPRDPGNMDYAAFLAWVAAGNVPDAADPARPPVDLSDLDQINRQIRALALLLRTYTNQSRAGNTTPVTLAALKADFKQAFDALP